MGYTPKNPNGQATMANSEPVVIASDQTAVPVSASSLPLPSGAATESTLAALNTKVPASPATDRTTAASPAAVRLSDGSAFYKPTTPTDTQPVSAASLPLPTGASTAAKQPALGTAGTPSSDVLTVQGVTSMTAIKTDGSATTQPVSGTVTANAGTGPFPVSDNAGSLTVDAPVGTPAFVRLSDGAAPIATLPVSLATNTPTLQSGSTTAVTQPTAANLNATVVGTGTFAVQAAGDVAAGATDSGNPVKAGGKHNTTAPTLTDGLRGDLQLGTRGSLKVTLFGSDSTNAVLVQSDNSDATATSGTSNKLMTIARNSVYNGSTWDRQYGDATNGTWANIKASVGVGSTGAAVPATAKYSATLAQTALPTAATAGNLTGALADKFGRQVVLPGTIRDLVGTQTTTISASTSETTIVTAAASTFNDLTALVVSNTSATAVRVDFRDTTAGSVLFSIYVPAGDVRGVSFSRPVPQTTVNTNWTAQSSASVTDLRIYAVFDKNK